jgi:Flp pilus assembly protein TadG
MCRELLKRISSFARNDHGVQLVELAIVLPLLVVLFAAAAEFGRYFYEYTTLAKSARTAVRYLVTMAPCNDPAAKKLVVYGNLAGTGSPVMNGLTTANVEIKRYDKDGNEVTGGVPATVTINIIDFQHTSLFKLGQLTKTSATLDIAVKPSVTMRYLLTQPPIGGCP